MKTLSENRHNIHEKCGLDYQIQENQIHINEQTGQDGCDFSDIPFYPVREKDPSGHTSLFTFTQEPSIPNKCFTQGGIRNSPMETGRAGNLLANHIIEDEKNNRNGRK